MYIYIVNSVDFYLSFLAYLFCSYLFVMKTYGVWTRTSRQPKVFCSVAINRLPSPIIVNGLSYPVLLYGYCLYHDTS